MKRTILSIVAGYLVAAILTGVTIAVLAAIFPESYTATNVNWIYANLAYGAIFALIGGYVVAWIAKENGVRNAMILAAIMAVLGAATFVSSLSTMASTGQPMWYYPAVIITSVPATILGAYLRSQQQLRIA